MGDEQDDYFAARHAAFKQQFGALPAAGSAAYWQCIKTTGEGALQLEVLSYCLRERLQAGARYDVGRIFAVMVGRLQAHVQQWARRIAAWGHDSKKLELEPDLEQECYERLWKELSRDEDPFLLVHFWSTLNRIEQHAATAVMTREGLWNPTYGDRPKRVPRKYIDSLEAKRNAEIDAPLEEGVADPASEDSFEQTASFLDLLTLLEKLEPKIRATVYARVVEELTALEIAEEEKLSDRAVRYRFEQARQQLRPWLSQREEERRV